MGVTHSLLPGAVATDGITDLRERVEEVEQGRYDRDYGFRE